VFTPNSDGVNDGWRLSGGFVGADAWIYSRWGTLVHEGEMAKSQWDGTNQRSGDDCPEGVYYYVLQLLRADGQVKDLKGYVHLLR
jgi:gliding motility-associated-like protein